MSNHTHSNQKTHMLANLSLLSIILTVLIASVHYISTFGHLAIVAGISLVLIIMTICAVFQYTRNTALLIIYGLLNTVIIVGAGLFDGFWNHAFKLFVYYLHGGYIPPMLTHLFQSTVIGSQWYEGTAILTFVASMFAAYFTYRFFRARYVNSTNEEN